MRYRIFLLCVAAIGVTLPYLVAAQPVPTIALNLDYPKFGPFDLNVNQSLPEMIGFFYYFIVGISGLAAFVMLVYGGVQWLTSGAIPSQASEARDKVRNAIIGLLLVLASFLIIQVINPELTVIGGKPLIDPCSDSAKKAKCTPGTAITPLSSSNVTLTVDSKSSLSILPGTASIAIDWKTTQPTVLCQADTVQPAAYATLWTGAKAESGSETVAIATIPDGTFLQFNIRCTDATGTVEANAFVTVTSISGGGSPAVINSFEVSDPNATTPTWLSGPGTFACCGPGTDFVGTDISLRWDATATACFGEDQLAGFVPGSNPTSFTVDPIPLPFAVRVYDYTLHCTAAGGDTLSTIKINKTL